MDAREHEYFIQWIISDYIPINDNYYISSPNRQARMRAEEVFFEFYYRAVDEGLVDGEDLYKLLIKYKVWNVEKENLLKKMEEEVKELKVQVFQNYLNSGTRNNLRIAINDTENYINNLLSNKHSFDMFSAEGVATCAKNQFLLGNSIFKKNGRPFWNSKQGWTTCDNILNIAYNKLNKFRLTSKDFREIARSDSWRSLWNVKKGINLFGKPLVDLTSSQQALVSWSTLYDNIYKSPDCPAEEILQDDDAVDGWLIIQKRKRDGESNKSTINSLITNEKIRNSQHIFILTDEQNIDKVYQLNDVGGKVALAKRLNQIKRDKVVNELNMIDTREHIQQIYLNMKEK